MSFVACCFLCTGLNVLSDAQLENEVYQQAAEVAEIVQYGIPTDKTASVALGDIDGDGDLDLVTANGRHWPGQNRIYRNNGDGTFEKPVPLFDQEDNSYAAPLADLDQDGDLDIVVGNDRMPSYVLINDGTGKFEKSQELGRPTSTRSITLADIDGKNGIDILVTNRGNPNQIFFNNGDGKFDDVTTFGNKRDSTIDVAVADLNGDGHTDLALANRDGQANQICFGDGTGQFNRTQSYGTGADETRGVAIADIDGDGHLDIINANIGQSNAIYFGDGQGGFDRSTSLGGRKNSFCVTALTILNDKHKANLLVFGNVQSGNTLWLRREDGEMRSFSFGRAKGATYGVTTGDIDGDGVPEIASANSDSTNGLFRIELEP